jgi:hypothetical protein
MSSFCHKRPLPYNNFPGFLVKKASNRKPPGNMVTHKDPKTIKTSIGCQIQPYVDAKGAERGVVQIVSRESTSQTQSGARSKMWLSGSSGIRSFFHPAQDGHAARWIAISSNRFGLR